MGFYWVCVNGGECVIIKADSCDEAGNKARVMYPFATSIILKFDNFSQSRSHVGMIVTKNYATPVVPL
jgi:hypothetical protein